MELYQYGRDGVLLAVVFVQTVRTGTRANRQAKHPIRYANVLRVQERKCDRFFDLEGSRVEAVFQRADGAQVHARTVGLSGQIVIENLSHCDSFETDLSRHPCRLALTCDTCDTFSSIKVKSKKYNIRLESEKTQELFASKSITYHTPCFRKHSTMVDYRSENMPYNERK